jgi:glucose-1-phosphate adenylyltransferase
MLQPYKGRFDTDWYAGTADAVTQNLNFVRRGRPDYVVILSGDHIYEMDYDVMLQFHRENNADATVATIRVPLDEASRFGIVDVDENYKVREFVEKPPNAPGNLASMGVYIFNYPVLEHVLAHDAQLKGSNHDFGKDILPRMVIEDMRVFAYPYGGYWIDVGTLDAYWEAHMDLLQSPPSLNLNDRTWVIHTRSEERPPVQIHAGSVVRDSLITNGTVIAEGAVVERSVLSPGVYVGPNAVVRESIVLTDTYIEAGAVVERAIIDKIAVIGHNAHVGSIQNVGDLGITCVGKNTHVPAGYTVGRSVILGTDLRLEDFERFENRTIPHNAHVGYESKK